MIPDVNQMRIFVRPGTTDMRKQVDGLAALVRDRMGANPGDAFGLPLTGACICLLGWAAAG